MALSFFANPELVQAHDVALAGLAKTPDSLELKRQAVLSLARTGALEHAQSEFLRYGLDLVADDEKVIALSGRLLKDLALEKPGLERRQLAHLSAQKYAAAYQIRNGLYPAINAASMAFVSGWDSHEIHGWCDKAESALPVPPYKDREEAYYAEASRAEIALLRGETPKAKSMLRHAIQQDPLNYTGHATTIKQFRMILSTRGEATAWLLPFAPPKSVHFAGHIFYADPQNVTLREKIGVEISEAIQQHDIGFGFGALAAGADILIAETLLQEGGKLHVILPSQTDLFIETSVSPFGDDWLSRFENCMNEAASLHHVQLASNAQSAVAASNFASDVAMGLTRIHADWLGGQSAQLLIWDGETQTQNSSTAMSAAKWAALSDTQWILPPRLTRAGKVDREMTAQTEHSACLSLKLVAPESPPFLDSPPLLESPGAFIAALKEHIAQNHRGIGCEDSPHGLIVTGITSAVDAAFVALDLLDTFQAKRSALDVASPLLRYTLKIGAHLAPSGEGASNERLRMIADKVADVAMPLAIWVSLDLATHLKLRAQDDLKLEYLGAVPQESSLESASETIRAFLLRRNNGTKKLL